MSIATVVQIHDDEGECALPAGTSLRHDQYTIERFHVRGGFGITYTARDTLNRRVLIKECFANEVCDRRDKTVIPLDDGKAAQFRGIKNRFMMEAQLMARLNHANIPTVHQVFAENNTIYLVTDLIVGTDLLGVALHDPTRLTPSCIRALLNVGLETISALHQSGIVHRDISPDNFVIGTDDALHLIDFGNASSREANDVPVVSHKSGYTPPEQYIDGTIATLTGDIYGLAATFHLLITGHPPPDAAVRQSAEIDPYKALAPSRRDYDDRFLNLLDDALSLDPARRPQTAMAWLDELRGLKPTAQITQKPTDRRTVRQISTLVAETNAFVDEPALPEPTKVAGPAPKVIVDIFGDPIEYFDQWLADQDAAAKRNKSHATEPTIFRSISTRFKNLLTRKDTSRAPAFRRKTQ